MIVMNYNQTHVVVQIILQASHRYSIKNVQGFTFTLYPAAYLQTELPHPSIAVVEEQPGEVTHRSFANPKMNAASPLLKPHHKLGE